MLEWLGGGSAGVVEPAQLRRSCIDGAAGRSRWIALRWWVGAVLSGAV